MAVQKTVLRAKLASLPVEPTDSPRLWVYRLVRSKVFEGAVMAMIVCNIGLMAATHDGEPPLFSAVSTALNIVFSTLFLCESLLKLYGMGKRAFWSDPWNRFDAAIVFGGLVDIGFSLSEIFINGSLMPLPPHDNTVAGVAAAAAAAGYDTSLNSTNWTGLDGAAGAGAAAGTAAVGRTLIRVGRLIRVFRVVRMFRLLRSMQGVVELLKAVFLSLPSLFNVGSLLALFLFIYAVAGVSLFGLVVHNGVLTEHANFSTWPLAMLTLVRLATGEEWQLFMRACMVGTYSNSPPCEGKHCGTMVALPYFMSFVTLLTFVMLSLFIAVILENFSKSKKPSEADAQKADIKSKHIDDFLKAWQRVASKTTADYLPWEKLGALLNEIPPPLGVGKHDADHRVKARRLVQSLKVQNYDGLVHYREVLLALSEALIGVAIPDAHNSQKDLAQLSKTRLPGKGMRQGGEGVVMLPELLAAMRLQRAFRRCPPCPQLPSYHPSYLVIIPRRGHEAASRLPQALGLGLGLGLGVGLWLGLGLG